ncbi:MAG: Peptidyl-prolyl cis-trans isomerase D [Syntrophorhabdus sp. PtaU1.Bin058]|nr:MAG: Peptidyl-prolyl cis-trans isomerase D [Syntrophorhabdus sp. PtaU1.Bin058]
MLKFMRRHATGYMVKAMFGLIILVFIFWGVGSFRDREPIVAEIGPYKVSASEYDEAYKRTQEFYKMIYREKLDENLLKELNLKEKVKDEIVNRYMLLIAADELGLAVSDREFLEHIQGIDAFKRDGKFDEKLYVAVLQRNNIDPKKFETTEKNTMLIQKVANFIKDNGTFFSDVDVWAGYVKEKGMVNLSYNVFDPSSFRNKVDITEKELLELYEKEKESHRSENAYQLKYLVIGEKGPVKDDAAYMDLLKVKDIDKYGEQKGLHVVDLGMMKESEVMKRLKDMKVGDWLRGLKKGDITLPIREGGRSFIFQLVDVQDGKPLDKSVVLAIIKERIIAERSKNMARLAAEDAIARKSIGPGKETGFILRSAHEIKGIGDVPKDNIGLLALSKDKPLYGKPVEISGKFYVFSFKDARAPDTKEWQKEKDSYTRYFVAKNREEFFKSFMTEMRTNGKVKISWQET